MADNFKKTLLVFQYKQVEKIIEEVIRKFLVPKFKSYDMVFEEVDV